MYNRRIGKMASLLAAYSAFTGSHMNNKTSSNIEFEKTNIKGLSSEEMGTKGNKKLSRSKRKQMKERKKQNGNRRNKTSYI